MRDKLAEQITDAVQPAVGKPLERLRVRAFDCDVQSVADFQVPRFYVGGEVQLDFPQSSLFISWRQGAGWEDDCSVAAKTSTFFIPSTALVDWDLAQVQPWSAVVGKRLASVRVLALGRTPHVIELAIGGHKLAIANSYQDEVGPGDDLLVGFDVDLALEESVHLMWEV